MKAFKILTGISLAILLNSCTLGYFVPKTQKVSISFDPKATLLIDKKEPVLKDNKYVLNCDGSARQISIKRDGYKTINKVYYPHNLSPAAYGTVALNAAIGGIVLYNFVKNDGSGAPPMLFGVLGGTIAGVWGAGLASLSPKMMRYDSQMDLSKDTLQLIPTKSAQMKEIKLNKVSVDILPENHIEYYPNYKQYINGEYVQNNKFKRFKSTKIENTYFSDELNSLLKKNGFIDTSGLVLRTSYNQNAFLNATVIGYKSIGVVNSNPFSQLKSTDFVTAEMKIKWDVLDYYKNILFSDTIITKSGEYKVSYELVSSSYNIDTYSTTKSTATDDAISDAIESSLYSLMSKPKFKSFMKLDNKIEKDTLPLMEIRKPIATVSSIPQAVEASVTIKTSKGHGSGFFISDDGYIVTNYHVVADTVKLEVIMNDGLKFKPQIIRSNKVADLAILKIERKNIVPYKLEAESQISIGKEIYVIGTPSAEDLSQTLTKGIISSFRKQTNGSGLIQTDASINGGNSGGPLIDKTGRLIGIVNAKLVGLGVEGIAFAIPQDVITGCLAIRFK